MTTLSLTPSTSPPRPVRAAGALFLAAVALLIALSRPAETARYDQAPEFPTQDPREWIGPPQSLAALKGKVVILDVWTFG